MKVQQLITELNKYDKEAQVICVISVLEEWKPGDYLSFRPRVVTDELNEENRPGDTTFIEILLEDRPILHSSL